MDEPALREALERAAAGRPVHGRSRAMARPLLRAVGHLPGVVAAAGSRTGRDVWRAAPPLAVLGALSRLFPRLPADRRGPAAAAVAVLVVCAAAAGLAVLT